MKKIVWSCVIALCALSLTALAQNRNARPGNPARNCPACATVCTDSCPKAGPADSLRCRMRPCPKDSQRPQMRPCPKDSLRGQGCPCPKDSTCMRPCAKQAPGCCGKAAVCPKAQKAEGCVKCPACPKGDSTVCRMGMKGAQCKTECLCPAAKGDTTVCAHPRHHRGPRGAHRGR